MSETHACWERDGFTVTADPARIDRAAVHAFLSGCYWAEGIPRATVDRSIDGSLCFALLKGEEQVGFARVITDRATFAYLGDVHVLDAWRGQGLGRWLMDCVMQHPDLSGLRRWVLVTRDAHALYAPLGFTPLANPAGYMELHRPDVYRGGSYCGNSNCTSSGTEKS
ncbi:MAG: GNAT family N-acetyltransferase [Proteobacteria bacterium]|nr:GNAT family N-acetyltransferase [Pseudomonadota bacterium]